MVDGCGRRTQRDLSAVAHFLAQTYQHYVIVQHYDGIGRFRLYVGGSVVPPLSLPAGLRRLDIDPKWGPDHLVG